MAGIKKHRAELRRSATRLDYLRITRRPKRVDDLDGYVVGIGRSWVLLATSLDGLPGGFTACRLCDIKSIDRAPGSRFIRRSLQAHAAWPPKPPDSPIDLDGGVHGMVESAALAAPLVAIHPELDDPGICYIGRPAGWSRRKLFLHEVNPKGRWVSRPYSHRIEWITRVEFGGRYETNLAIVAGDEPAPRGPA